MHLCRFVDTGAIRYYVRVLIHQSDAANLDPQGVLLAKQQNTVEKRRREVEKKRKAQEKNERRRRKKEQANEPDVVEPEIAADDSQE